MSIDLGKIRPFDVLRNSLNGELGVVLCVKGDHLELRGKSGELLKYKFGKHFSAVDHDESVEFRAAVRAARKVIEQNAPKKKRPRSLTAFLNKLAKKR